MKPAVKPAVKIDPFYPIFDNTDWLRRLLPLGIRLVQLRAKALPAEKLRREIRLARRLCAAANCVLVVNDHWRMAIEEGCGFVHLGQEDLDAADMAAIRRAGLRVGLSTHDHAELDRAMRLDPDYIALGPVYPTILKQMQWREQGLARLTEWKSIIGKTPLVAIGGMRVERAAGAFAAGADIVSVVTDITLNTDPGARVSEWLSATRGACP